MPTIARRTRRAFSLIELMLVLVILGLLGTVATVALLPQAEKARVKVTKATLDTIGSAIKQYSLEEGSLPPNIQALVTAQYIDPGKIKDGWRRPLFYRPQAFMGHDFQLSSQGKNVDDPSDDIDYWTMNE